jgi:hypothetical protein
MEFHITPEGKLVPLPPFVDPASRLINDSELRRLEAGLDRWVERGWFYFKFEKEAAAKQVKNRGPKNIEAIEANMGIYVILYASPD